VFAGGGTGGGVMSRGKNPPAGRAHGAGCCRGRWAGCL
jgi:hypothetical protein